MPLTHEQAQIAHKMASEGYTIAAIQRRLGLQGDGWHAVRAEVESWQGLKQGISLQLEKLANETDPDERQKIKTELDSRIDRLYEQACDVAEKVHYVRDALGEALDG